MNKINPKKIAFLIPIAYLLHLADEYFTGFPGWFSGVFNTELSLNDFLIINSVGFTITLLLVIFYAFNKIHLFVIVVLGILFFVNGVVHIIASILTATYSPGTLSGILIYVPLGILIFKKIFPLVPEEKRLASVIVAIAIQIIVSLIAFNI